MGIRFVGAIPEHMSKWGIMVYKGTSAILTDASVYLKVAGIPGNVFSLSQLSNLKSQIGKLSKTLNRLESVEKKMLAGKSSDQTSSIFKRGPRQEMFKQIAIDPEYNGPVKTAELVLGDMSDDEDEKTFSIVSGTQQARSGASDLKTQLPEPKLFEPASDAERGMFQAFKQWFQYAKLDPKADPPAEQPKRSSLKGSKAVTKPDLGVKIDAPEPEPKGGGN
jgi:hypothetical protein